MRARVIAVATLVLTTTLCLSQYYLLYVLSRSPLSLCELIELAKQSTAYGALLPRYCFYDLTDSLHLQLYTSRNCP